MALVLIPGPLRRHTSGAPELRCDGADVRSVLQSLCAACPPLQPLLFDERVALRGCLCYFVNDEDCRALDGEHTAIGPGDRLEILPALAGGVRYPEWLTTLRREVPQIDSETLLTRLAGPDPRPRLVDVRSAEEWETGHVPGSLHLDRGFLETNAEAMLPGLDAPVVVLCENGSRSLFAAQALQQLGYRDVANLDGGLHAWKDAGGSLQTPPALAPSDRRRYLRQLSLPEVGEAGQQALARARVLVVGAGGLGSPVALYLAAAGVGTLTLVDADQVDESNLQRQLLHTTDRVGLPKTTSAMLALRALNPSVRVVERRERFDTGNALALVEAHDVVVDGSDNLATRYAIDAACTALGRPMVHGAVFRFEGQVSVFDARRGPCYRCLHAEPPPAELAPSCADAGVLGALPGVIGTLQATEVLKLLLGIGEPLIGRVLRLDALAGRMRELRFARRPHCRCAAGAAAAGGIDEVAVPVCTLA
jgi:molybdopterin/thiamine biosynthesis adenylyltransferase/rhodanese-related sulfurtransferase/molybdopterin converting factor small subunit